MERIELGEIEIEVIRKSIKNIHLSVYPPVGRVRLSAPERIPLDTIRVFALSKLAWIKSQQKKLRAQARETQREYVNRETHYVWGERYLIQVIERDAVPSVSLDHSTMVLSVRPNATRQKKREVVDSWYRELVKQALPEFIQKWEPIMGVSVKKVLVRRMKTRWGSCTPATAGLRINTDLAKKPPECLEYILVHEMAHLLEPSHNQRFIRLMDQFMPKWQFYRDELNRLPVRHEDWGY